MSLGIKIGNIGFQEKLLLISSQQQKYNHKHS